MGIWKVKNRSFEVNIVDRLIIEMKQDNCLFCWIKDNPGIADEENSLFYCDKTIKLSGKEKNYRGFKDTVEVSSANGRKIKGCIYHWVRGPCSGTPLRDWFIIKPFTQI